MVEFEGGKIRAGHEPEYQLIRIYIAGPPFVTVNINLSNDRDTVRSISGRPPVPFATLQRFVQAGLLTQDVLEVEAGIANSMMKALGLGRMGELGHSVPAPGVNNAKASDLSEMAAGTVRLLFPDGPANDLCPLDQALAEGRADVARGLVRAKRRKVWTYGDSFWGAVLDKKSENQDLLRAMLILYRNETPEFTQVRLDNMVSRLHRGMDDIDERGEFVLDTGLRDCLREIPYYSPGHERAVNTHCSDDGWECRHLAMLWGRQRAQPGNAGFQYQYIANPDLRNKQFDCSAEDRRYHALRARAETCYPVLIEACRRPGQKSFGDMLVALFNEMEAGQSRQFLVESTNHAMFLELEKIRENDTDVLAASLYDPNYRDVHKQAQTTRPELVREEWNLPALLANDHDRDLYWRCGTAHAMIAEVTDWAALERPARMQGRRRAATMEYAARSASDVVYYLSDYGLDESLRDFLQELPPHAILDLLHTRHYGGNTPLRQACQNGHKEIVKLIRSVLSLDQFIELMKLGCDKGPPLLIACEKGHKEVLEFIQDSLEDQFASLIMNGRTEEGVTPLLVACQNGHKEIVDLMRSALSLDQFIDLMKVKCIRGTTPLRQASQNGHKETVELIWSVLSPDQFIELMKLRCNQGTTPVFLACEFGHTKIVEFIQAHVPPAQFSALVNAPHAMGMTPLSVARQNQNKDIVRIIESALQQK